MIDESIFDENYLEPAEYKMVKGIDLDTELSGSTDDPDNDAKRFIFRVEKKVIAWLNGSGYNFEESMITETDHSLLYFKLGICDQIECEIRDGEDAEICENAQKKFKSAGLMNMRRGHFHGYRY